jgi:hypothetical protein
MPRVTVRWHAAAEDELAEIWLNASDADVIERAANEIDALLRMDPSSKGRPVTDMDPESMRAISARSLPIPSELRWLRCGPLEVVFRASEDDCMAIVLHVARSGDGLESP